MTAYRPLLLAAALLVPVAAAALPSTPQLGQAEGRCRPGERGPAFLVHVAGLKDRGGRIKVELFAPVEGEFLGDDNKLVAEGKVFRRVIDNLPPSGNPVLCIRAPGPGVWALMVMHDRNANGKFDISQDGIGFPTNPASLGPFKPKPAVGRAVVGAGPTSIAVRMLYRRGLFSFGPVAR